FGTLEAVTNWLFLDFSGIIDQQAISAFGPQSPSASNINTNSTETSTYRLSPYIRGKIAGIVDYSLRYNWSTTQANASAASNTELSDWSGQVRGSTPFQNLKWSVDATQQTSTYSQGRTSDAERLYASVTYTIVPQFRISLSGGTESNNYASQNMETHPTHGYGFDWTPTERTAISAFKETRFFGDGHRYSLSHRFPLSSISYSDTKNVAVLPNQFTTVGFGTVYDLFYPLYYYLCSQDPNTPSQYADLDTCAKDRINKLGIPLNAQVTSDFLRSQATIQRSQQLAMAFQGSRNTLTVMFNRNQSQSMLAFAAVNDDFSQNNTTSISQRGVTINLSHRLSGLTNLSVMASRQESTGAGSSNLKAKTAMYQANLSSPLGAKTTGSISVRRTEFDSSTNPYTENAIIGTVSVIF
ncbi:MAG: TIGR03016 family PEP-CTERM system-associated outer membrane protein, partial [Dechloromonas sp.]|nr:TIGR03016 family PEP-CTERM system-associated outer membrane protein [Dechloromonas sp.]